MPPARRCVSDDRNALRENLARLGLGPPAEGKKDEDTLMYESRDPVEGQMYPELSDAHGTAETMLENDMRSAGQSGMKVLTCGYDEDPNKDYIDLQYYWGVGTATTVGFAAGPFGGEFLKAFQQKYQHRGADGFTHPFLTYGSPRLECPAKRDAALPVRQMYASSYHLDPRRQRFALGEAPSKPGPQIPAPTQPPRQFQRNYTTVFSYDMPVPAGFVPPIPKFEATRLPVYIEMPEQKDDGSLGRIAINTYRPGTWRMSRAQDDQANADWANIEAEEQRQGRNALLLMCIYYGAPPTAENYWLGPVPTYVTLHKHDLLAHWPQSEFVNMKGVSNCPARTNH